MKECEHYNLPQGQEYRVWSKAILRQKVGHDQVLNDYLVEDGHYSINQKTLALYEFQQQPLLGKYKSVIFDIQAGIILSYNSTRSLFTTFSKECLLAGLEFQREFARKINLKNHNTIATGRLAYFSTRSYNSGNIDWVALHQMVAFQPLNLSAVAFKTVSCGDSDYIFAFDNCSRYISEQIDNGLFYNHALYQLASVHLERILGWHVTATKGKSLIDQPEYFHPHEPLTNLSLKHILASLLDKKQQRYGHYLANFYEFPELVESHRIIRQISQRPDTLY
ncbi:hypothetical protein GYM68_08790 [Lactobacillus panisapium]|uniref:hypothetical protein n=1 Tax=Lactobacillus panisapium TaxID=2012495 RepID=UPI001C699343|nr:hypothetical protein [Lactobacillus panisapium]QYN59330.1 hypothetical protein GYM68_08790 [Lactobacillus panisapium]